MLYRAEDVVGVFQRRHFEANGHPGRGVAHRSPYTAAQTFPRLPVVGYESGRELERR